MYFGVHLENSWQNNWIGQAVQLVFLLRAIYVAVLPAHVLNSPLIKYLFVSGFFLYESVFFAVVFVQLS